MEQLFLKFIAGLTVLDMALVLAILVLWRDNTVLRKTIIEMLEKTVEAKIKNIETLNQIENAIEKHTAAIDRFKDRT